jgi:hypothetical protein
MRSILLVLLCIVFPLSAVGAEADPYNNDYCKNPVQLQQWAKILEETPYSDAAAALHALWVGLCVQVEMHNLTTNRAQDLFQNFRDGIVESVRRQEKENWEEPSI